MGQPKMPRNIDRRPGKGNGYIAYDATGYAWSVRKVCRDCWQAYAAHGTAPFYFSADTLKQIADKIASCGKK